MNENRTQDKSSDISVGRILITDEIVDRVRKMYNYELPRGSEEDPKYLWTYSFGTNSPRGNVSDVKN